PQAPYRDVVGQAGGRYGAHRRRGLVATGLGARTQARRRGARHPPRPTSATPSSTAAIRLVAIVSASTLGRSQGTTSRRASRDHRSPTDQPTPAGALRHDALLPQTNRGSELGPRRCAQFRRNETPTAAARLASPLPSAKGIA